MTVAVQLTEANQLRIECTRILRTITEAKNAIKAGQTYVDSEKKSGPTWQTRLDRTQDKYDEKIAQLTAMEQELGLPVTKEKEMMVTVQSILDHLEAGMSGRPSRPEHDKVRDTIFKGRLKLEALKEEAEAEAAKGGPEKGFGRPKKSAAKKLKDEQAKIDTNVALLEKMVGAKIDSVKAVAKPDEVDYVADDAKALTREEKNEQQTGNMDALLAEQVAEEEKPKKRKPGRPKGSSAKNVDASKEPEIHAPAEVFAAKEEKPIVGMAAAAGRGQMPIDLIQEDKAPVEEPQAEVTQAIAAPVYQAPVTSTDANLLRRFDELQSAHAALKFEYSELNQSYLALIKREEERMTRKAKHMAGEY